MTLFMRWGMFITSYIPLYFILVIKYLNFSEIKFSQKSFISFFTGNKIDLFFWLFIILMFMISIITLVTFKLVFTKKGSNQRLDTKINDVSNLQDSEMSYLLTYVVPLASINNTSDSKALLTNLILFFLIGLMYTRNNLVYLNPAFSLVGYTVFRINQKIYITKVSKTALDSIISHNDKVYVSELGGNIYYLNLEK